MNRRIAWAVMGSVLLHLGLMGSLHRAGLAPSGRPEQAVAGKLPLPAIQVQLWPGVGASKATSEAAAEALAVQGPSKLLRPSPDSADRRAVRKGPKTAPADTRTADANGTGDTPDPLTGAHAADTNSPPVHGSATRPLNLEWPAHGAAHVPLANLLQRSQRPDRTRTGFRQDGGWEMHETQDALNGRRATVTTPWGRYCMRERRSAGPYDARRDRGMDAVTCADG